MIEIGQRVGRLTVVQFAGRPKWNQKHWLCHCDCGNEKVIYEGSLRNNLTQSCGCLRDEYIKKHLNQRLDLTGQRFGKLVVLNESHTEKGKWFWNCQCSCGNKCVFQTSDLTRGFKISCGCQKKTAYKLTTQFLGQKFGKVTVQEYISNYANKL